VAAELNRTCGTHLSANDVSMFSKNILPEALAWLHRPIVPPIDYLFLDALYLPVRKPGFTTDQALLVAVGITPEKLRIPLGFMLGDRENNDSWGTFLKELLSRGLSGEALTLVISDDHKAIAAAVKDVLAADHQLCVVHKMRNALCRVASKHKKEFYADFTAIYWAESKDEALRALGRLESKGGKLYPKATQIACARPQAFLRFMEQPKALWKTLRSTNLIERFNREIRRRLDPAGAMHSENELWKLIWSVASAQELRWAKRYKPQNIKELKNAA
jgi:putative transposase